MNRAIIIMTKVPAAGNVKTRLSPILSTEQCAELAECFLRDTVEKANQIKILTIIAFSPVEARENLIEILPTEKFIVEQTGENLGERMLNAFQFAFSQNFDAVVMIGTDSPTFPSEFLTQAFESLVEDDAVLGKTADGGFYLIGLRTLKKEIFEAVAWSSSETFEQTKRNIINSNYSLREIPAWYDVDEPEDLERLAAEFQSDEKSRRAAPKTFEWLANRESFLKAKK